MAFPREENVTIETIEDFSVSFFVPGPSNIDDQQSGEIDIQLGLSNGKFGNRQYDLIARLNDDPTGQAHLANLIDLRDYIQVRLNNEVLPSP
jgi:hypothetical protein